MVLESACVPIPSEVTMLFGGALVTASFLAPDQQLELWAVVAAGTIGNLVGSWLAYWAGYKGGRPMIDRYGKYLLIRPHEVDRAHDWFERYGEFAVFGGRLLPVVRTFISLPAGVVRMPFWRFTFYTVLGCLPWCLLLAWEGARLGERWDEVEHLIRPVAWAIVALLVLGAAWFVRRRLRTIKREEAERAAATTAVRDGTAPSRGAATTDASVGTAPGGVDGAPIEVAGPSAEGATPERSTEPVSGTDP